MPPQADSTMEKRIESETGLVSFHRPGESFNLVEIATRTARLAGRGVVALVDVIFHAPLGTQPPHYADQQPTSNR